MPAMPNTAKYTKRPLVAMGRYWRQPATRAAGPAAGGRVSPEAPRQQQRERQREQRHETKVLRQPASTASAPPSMGASARTEHSAPFR